MYRREKNKTQLKREELITSFVDDKAVFQYNQDPKGNYELSSDGNSLYFFGVPILTRAEEEKGLKVFYMTPTNPCYIGHMGEAQTTRGRQTMSLIREMLKKERSDIRLILSDYDSIRATIEYLAYFALELSKRSSYLYQVRRLLDQVDGSPSTVLKEAYGYLPAEHTLSMDLLGLPVCKSLKDCAKHKHTRWKCAAAGIAYYLRNDLKLTKEDKEYALKPKTPLIIKAIYLIVDGEESMYDTDCFKLLSLLSPTFDKKDTPLFLGSKNRMIQDAAKEILQED